MADNIQIDIAEQPEPARIQATLEDHNYLRFDFGGGFQLFLASVGSLFVSAFGKYYSIEGQAAMEVDSPWG